MRARVSAECELRKTVPVVLRRIRSRMQLSERGQYPHRKTCALPMAKMVAVVMMTTMKILRNLTHNNSMYIQLAQHPNTLTTQRLCLTKQPKNLAGLPGRRQLNCY